MANVEAQLLSRIIRKGCLNKVIEWGIQLEDFKTPQYNGLFYIMMSTYRAAETRGSVIGRHSMKEIDPGFKLCDDKKVSVEALCHAVRSNRVKIESSAILAEAQEAIESNHTDTLTKLRKDLDILIDLGHGSRHDLSFSSAINEIVDRYELAKKGIPLSGVTWPWTVLNTETGGIMNDDYIIFYGRPKQKKSFMLSYMVSHLFKERLRVLVYTKEMTPFNIFMRIAACIAGLPYQEFRTGKLSREEYYDLLEIQKISNELDKKNNLWCLSGRDTPGRKGDTIPWLQAKIEKYKPDVVCIDGLYLMSPTTKGLRDHSRVEEISNDCREMILATGVPVVATTQANRKAAGHKEANTEDIGHTDAIGRDATVLFRVISDDVISADGKVTSTVILATAGSREFKMEGLRVGGVPAVDFGFKSCITSNELETAKKKEEKIVSEEEEAKKMMSGKKRSKKGVPAEMTREATEAKAIMNAHIKRMQS
jgi:replicative DNA helicase